MILVKGYREPWGMGKRGAGLERELDKEACSPQSNQHSYPLFFFLSRNTLEEKMQSHSMLWWAGLAQLE